VKKSLLSCLFVVFVCSIGHSYQLLGHEKLNYYDETTIKQTWKKIDIPQLYLPVNNGVYIYEITYLTSWVDGTPVKATGIVMIPDNIHSEYSTIIYHNGTNIMKKREQELGYNQFSICAGLAADGYVVVIPDYIGRGNGERSQLYLNAKTEGQNSVDMLLSLNGFLKDQGYDPIHDLYITGYSQGGHAAMSTQRLIEKNYTKEFDLVASSPMSGPYDLEASVVVDPNNKEGDWVLFMYLIKSFQDAYQMRTSLSEIFVAPWDSLVTVYFDGYTKYNGIRKGLPSNVMEIFNQDFMAKEFLSEQSLFKKILKENSVYDFVPTVPTQLCYCSDDEVVTYKNSENAYNWMKKNGAKKLKIKDAGKNLDHEECAIFTVIYTKFFFDKYRDIKHSNFRNDFSNAALSIATSAKKLFPKIKLF
jgi:pimeloyl-ACP methyl ester carboxylesterase